MDLNTHVLIVEVDEQQHRNYSCENKRTMELFQDAGNRPIVFIRFNPHKYINSRGVTVPSPWTKTKQGRPRVNAKRTSEWHKRLDALFARIEYWTQLQGFPAKEVTVEYLFYDA